MPTWPFSNPTRVMVLSNQLHATATEYHARTNTHIKRGFPPLRQARGTQGSHRRVQIQSVRGVAVGAKPATADTAPTLVAHRVAPLPCINDRPRPVHDSMSAVSVSMCTKNSADSMVCNDARLEPWHNATVGPTSNRSDLCHGNSRHPTPSPRCFHSPAHGEQRHP